MKKLFNSLILILADMFRLAFLASQGQMSFDEGQFSFDSVNIGIIDIELGEEASEIDVSDTETTSGESEYLSGKTARKISFTGFHKSGQPTLETKVDHVFSLIVTDENGATTTFSGTCQLSSKSITGSRDGAMQVKYAGRIQGALGETSSSS